MEIVHSSVLTILAIIAWTLFLRTFPNILSTGIVKRIEHTYNAKLEELKGRIRASEASVSSAVSYLAEAQSELRSKVISSVESLWRSINACHETYLSVYTANDVLLQNELDDFFRGRSKKVTVAVMLEEYKDISFITERMEKIKEDLTGTEILFVSSRLWMLYTGIVTMHARLGFLISQSFKTEEYIDWRYDKHLRSVLDGVLDEERFQQAASRRVGGLKEIYSRLSAEFVEEASHLIRGERELAHSVPAIYEVLSKQYDVNRSAILTP